MRGTSTAVAALCLAMMLAAAGCGSSSNVNPLGGQTTSTTPPPTGGSTGGTTRGGVVAPVMTPLPSQETTPPSGGINTTAASSYVVLAWNDLGMHCLNPTYDTAVILPPYNTVWAQVIQRGNPPRLVITGVNVSYRLILNTTSQKGAFAQFWTYAKQLFGAAPAIDQGLNLDDPAVSNGLSGTMLAKSDHFQVSGIPVTPVNDGNTWTPYQLAEITVTNSSTGAVLAKTRATVPTSDEINCGKCHGNSSDPAVVLNDILAKHDANHGTTLQSQKPVLCASCHGSPVLGQSGPGAAGKNLSQAVHGFHGSLASPPACYDCHPGAVTQCSRSTKHTAADGNCVTCHNTGINGTGVAGVDTGAALYRSSTGHGGVYCAGCHGSPHAMVPTGQAVDNYQSVQYQGAAKTIGDCGVCHKTSRGGGNDFAGEHGSGRLSACSVCHTGFQNAGNTANWPHQFQWKSR